MVCEFEDSKTNDNLNFQFFDFLHPLVKKVNPNTLLLFPGLPECQMDFYHLR